jgi:hypothetical protein
MLLLHKHGDDCLLVRSSLPANIRHSLCTNSTS